MVLQKLTVFALVFALLPILVESGKHTEIHRLRKEHNRKHGALIREMKQTQSTSRKKVLEQEIAEALVTKNFYKYRAKGHTEEDARKIVDLETRLHTLQGKRIESGQTDTEKADHRLEMKALRSELQGLKFPSERQGSAGKSDQNPAKGAKNVKDLREQAKTLRNKIRATTDPLEKQKLREQLDKLYA